jgi:hypothetical protein
MDPSTRRLQRFTGVLILGILAVMYGSTLLWGGVWPSGTPWSAICLTGLAITFLLAPPGDLKGPGMRALFWVALSSALVSSIVALILWLRV